MPDNERYIEIDGVDCRLSVGDEYVTVTLKDQDDAQIAYAEFQRRNDTTN